MGGWEAVVSESPPPPLSLLFFDSLLFSSPLATTPGSDANLPSPPFLSPLLPFPFWEPLRILLSFLRRFLWRYTPALAGGGEFWELGKFNKILMIALSRSPSLLPPSFEASPASPTSSKGRRK